MTIRCPTCGQTTGSLGDLTDAERDELVKELADAVAIDRGNDGELLIDWSPSPGRIVTLSLREDGRLSYAFHWDGEKQHGTAQMPAGSKAHARYEYLRRLTPRQFMELWDKNISGGGRFDDLVDEAINTGKTGI